MEASSTAGSPSLAEAVKAEGPVRNRLSGPSLEAWQNAEAALMGAVEGMSQVSPQQGGCMKWWDQQWGFKGKVESASVSRPK